MLLADFAAGGQHIAGALAAAQHHFVDGGLRQHRSSKATFYADASHPQEYFVGIDVGESLQGELPNQGLAALVDLATGEQDGYQRVVRIADDAGVVWSWSS